MAARDKRRRWSPRRRRNPTPSAPTEPKPEPDKTPEVKAKAGADEKSGAETVIKKGIYLSALIYVEGEQAAPEDFAALTTAALKEKLKAALERDDSGLRMSLKKIEAQNDVEEDEAKGQGEEKFQF